MQTDSSCLFGVFGERPSYNGMAGGVIQPYAMCDTLQRRKRHWRRFRCGRKVGYRSIAHAARDMQRLINRQGEDARLQVYHCGRCKKFHVGREG